VPRNSHLRVYGCELTGCRVVIPRPEVVEAGLGVDVLSGELEGVGEAAGGGGEVAVGVVGVGVDRGLGGVGDEAGGAQLVGLVES